MVKALLNHALRDQTNGISDDHAWRLVKPFRGVAAPRAVHFSVEQARALIGAAPDKDFAELLTARGTVWRVDRLFGSRLRPCRENSQSRRQDRAARHHPA